MSTNELQLMLQAYQTLPLQQLPKDAALLNRVDTKYVLPLNQLSHVLQQCSHQYAVVTVNDHLSCQYQTQYYDSPDFSFYFAHHAGHAQRLKIRLRKYVETDTRFLEVKYRNNKGRTDKPRVKLGDGCNELAQLQHPVFSSIPTLQVPELCKSVMINYSRITLVSSSSAERVTIDIGLEFQNENKKVLIPDLVIVEVKQGRQSPSLFKYVMKQMHCPAGSISKYCLGVISLHQGIKKNRFKNQLIQIQKRTNYHVVTTNLK